MTESDIRAILLEALQELFEIDTAGVTGSTNLYAGLEIDSIDAVDLLDYINRRSGRKLQAEDFRSARTVDDIVRAVMKNDPAA